MNILLAGINNKYKFILVKAASEGEPFHSCWSPVVYC